MTYVPADEPTTVAVRIHPRSGKILDRAWSWETAQNMALHEGAWMRAIADDAGMTRDDAQALYDSERARYRDDRGFTSEHDGRKEVIREILSDDFDHDGFGTAIAWHFAIADILTDESENVPSEWEFRQAMGGSDDEDPRYLDLRAMLDAGTVTASDLVYVGNILSRYVAVLHIMGRTY